MGTRPGRFIQILGFLGIGPLFGLSVGQTQLGQVDVWHSIGFTRTDDGGSWRFDVNTGQDLIGASLTTIRVTNATCEISPDEAIVFETQVQPTQAGNRSWEGKLAAVGSPAQSLPPLDPSSGEVQFIPTPSGTQIVTGLDGVPPGAVLAVCLRRS